MKKYSVYLGTYEQFKYTFEASNMKEVLSIIHNKWKLVYSNNWFEDVETYGLPSGARRFFNDNGKRILIIPIKKENV